MKNAPNAEFLTEGVFRSSISRFPTFKVIVLEPIEDFQIFLEGG